MLTDPLAVTYDGSAKTLPRISAGPNRTVYRTADGEFEVTISGSPLRGAGQNVVTISMARRLPDPTPGDVFDDYRAIRNEFSLSYSFDFTRAETSVDIPKLRTALLAFVDSTLQDRLIGGEK
jgi:hypothetical protein